MREKLKPRSEKLLFHVTTSDVVDAICTHNFDRVCGKNGTKYGQGSYFVVDASYSNKLSKLEGDKTRYMFVAKVLTGEFKRGEQNFRRPPLIRAIWQVISTILALTMKINRRSLSFLITNSAILRI